MKASELRIGNWANDVGSQPYKIDAVDLVALSQSEIAGKINLHYNPIPLSPELLIDKCGMVKRFEADNCTILDYKNLAATENKTFSLGKVEGGYKYLTAPYAVPFQYLHQLQNLYYALTQTELEVNL